MQPRLDKCWFLPRTPPLFIQLGRFGDLILLFPAFKLIHDRIGEKPIVIVTETYASVFDGISYATPHVIQGHWYQDMPKAIAIAQSMAQDAIIPQWWQPGVNGNDIPTGPLVLQCHGHGWGVDVKKWTDFGTSMWSRAGFTRDEMLNAPLIFDRRDKERERILFEQRVPKSDRPILLYNFTGVSSPFGYGPEIGFILRQFSGQFNMVDLGTIRAHRIYDLLGLYDRAVGIITTDTATLHLCPASKIPSIMFCVDGWCSATPRGNCVLHCHYSEVPKRLDDISCVLKTWASQA